jgi:hypothetical protein
MSVPGTYHNRGDDGQTWMSEFVCTTCGECFIHIEMSPDPDDEAQGWPLLQACPGCESLGTMVRAGQN